MCCSVSHEMVHKPAEIFRLEDTSLSTSLSTSRPSSARRPIECKWYHTTVVNAFVIGGVGFIAPGLWNATNALGAGGAQEPFLVNAANALIFALMGILCLIGGPIANRIGLSNTLLLGAVGYPLYSADLYTYNRFGNVWFVLVGAVACSISAGLFWVSEGAIALAYPESGKRGKYMNIWLWFRTGGPLVGGAIVLALNNDAGTRKKDKVGYQTYLVFVTLQYLAVPLALAVSPPHKVQRSDGTAYFNQYNDNFQAYYFSVRAGALIGFVSQFGTLLSSQIISTLLDYKGFAVKKRITISFYYVMVWHIIAWIYAWVIQEKYTCTNPSFDWEDKGFVEGFSSLQNWLYYLLATKTDNISELSRFSQAISFGLNTRKWHGGRVPMGVNTILLGVAVYPTWLVVRDHAPVETNKVAEEENERVDEDVGRVEVVEFEEREKVARGGRG
ncbi:hypothetical protein K469DRAFT_734563 [Zopfia rhizophila CBS 207.26]|uniref:MFS general substrate transporter n=1 Tax=Zopfia rhizophila CBS 207.26 TaxID=1314779 RepID=A0A6A6ESI3_9PEZI|nr:hypothetical protein K469DRAFT_734563 [Zopfia rhizophila CBS 207.26]